MGVWVVVVVEVRVVSSSGVVVEQLELGWLGVRYAVLVVE